LIAAFALTSTVGYIAMIQELPSPPTVVIRLRRFQFKLSARLAREANGNRAQAAESCL
jgi:hypothetical protein